MKSTTIARSFWVGMLMLYLSLMACNLERIEPGIDEKNSSAFIVRHAANLSNTNGDISIIDDDRLNGQQTHMLFVTQAYGAYNRNEIGVRYQNDQWQIFTQNRSGIPLGSEYNILVIDPDSQPAPISFVHTTDRLNTTANYTKLNHFLTNNQQEKIIFISQRYGTYNSSAVGCWYQNGIWTIFNESRSSMPIGASFNVLVLSEGELGQLGELTGMAFTHQVDDNSKSGIATKLSAQNLPLSGSAKIFATTRFVNQYNPSPLGSWFDQDAWYLYNANEKEIRAGVQINILAAD